MTQGSKIISAVSALAILGAAGYAFAQSAPSPLSAALADGSIGEQADGYMGFRTAPAPALKAEVDSLNIKRRAEYTRIAGQKGRTIKEVGAAIGCETLATRVAVGRAYLLPDNVWRVRKAGETVELPAYCAP
jgi:uncharacterized protein